VKGLGLNETTKTKISECVKDLLEEKSEAQCGQDASDDMFASPLLNQEKNVIINYWIKNEWNGYF